MEYPLQRLGSTEELKTKKRLFQELDKIEKELRKRNYKNDCKAFINDLCKIKLEGGGIDSFKLWDYQEEIIDEIMTYKKLCYLKSRQMGFSWLMAAIILWMLIFKEYVTISIMSKGEDEAKKQLERVKFMYRQLPAWITPNIEKGGDNAQTFKLVNGSIINSLTAGGSGGRGDTAYFTLWDEAAFSPNDEEILKSLKPAAEKGIFVIQSTPNGMGNVFHQKYGDEDFFSKKYLYDRRSDRDEDWARANGKYSEDTKIRRDFAQEYGGDFVGSSLNVFDLDILKEYRTMVKPPLREVDGLKIWEEPILTESYAMGVDVANNVFKGDYCAFSIVKKSTTEVVARFKKRMLATKFGPRILEVSKMYNKALTAVERNNHGIVVLDYLKKHGCNLYYQKFYDNFGDKWTRKIGWYTDGKTKPFMIDELEETIRNKAISIYGDGTIDELEVFVYLEEGRTEKTGSLPNKHDDLVISLAIALQALKDVTMPKVINKDRMYDEYGNYSSIKKKKKRKPRFGKSCYY